MNYIYYSIWKVTKIIEQKTSTYEKRIVWIIVLFFSIVLSGCKPMSISVKGDDCKMDGSFEIIKNGLPVNWCYYAPETVPNSDFKILSDTTQHKDGIRSLKFQINSCESTGSWHSPGFFMEFKVLPGETYKVSLCVINKGCTLKIKAETGMKGNPGISEIVAEIQGTFSEWKCYEHTVRIPAANDNMRIEVNILSPGTVWFDDIKIEGVHDQSERTIYPYRGNEDCK
ncbi:MAG TPA: hypothetical protein PKW80_13610 [Bacteroidales bacterium]|nr:hypothetical protein [Bacteroidales bacterium]